MTVFNTKNVDFTKEFMFLGEELNTQRFDRARYQKFNQLTEQQVSFFWRPQEVSLTKDQSDFKKLSHHEKLLFTRNLRFQTLMDSIVGRSPLLAYLPIVSLPELEACINAWGFFETNIHSKSYSWIVQNVFADATDTLDSIMIAPEILERASYIAKYYDDLIEYVHKYKLGQLDSAGIYEMKKKLFLAMVSTNILEGIRFYSSFACNFALAENKLMEGSAKVLSLIARDENVHMAVTTTIINNWRSGKDDPDFLKIIEETRDDVIFMFEDVMLQEKEWATYLFEEGSIIGLNAKLLGQYIDFMGDKRSRALGYKLEIPFLPKSNPLPWTQHWLSSTGLQVAPQETEIETYVIGGLKQDVDKDTFKDFEL